MPQVFRVAALALLAALAVSLPGAGQTFARQTVSQAAAVQVPTIPDPIPVALDSSTTAFLALDFMDVNCAPRPTCVDTLPAVAHGLAAARMANVRVIYSGIPGGNVLPDVTPQPGDPMVISSADKFFNTDLDDLLKQHGITTVVITGTASNGAVLYTSAAAAARGYTVVVATDGISASTEFGTFFTEWQLLNAPGSANAQNMPLQPRAVTLTRTDLISYQ